MPHRNVLIAGGGIGGLTAALCLARTGSDVAVFEQASAFATAGVGIQLSPNCTRVLHALGLEEALRATAFVPEGTQARHWRNGKIITSGTLGADVLARHGAPYYHIHRGDLLRVLVAAAEQLPNVELHTNARVQGIEQSDDQVFLTLDSARHTGDVLIGADGIHSTVRAALWGAEQAEFTGNIAWRALVPTARLPAGLVRPMSTVWWGPGKHFVHYYVQGGAMVNCVCVVEKVGWEVESWTAQGELDELRADFAGWHSELQCLIDNADSDSLYKWALYDRPPMPQWGQGHVTLLGDACHPTLPFMAQGAAMAIEDGAVLAGVLESSSAVPAALQRYEDLRRARTAGIQNGSRRNAKVFHLSGVAAWLRNRAAAKGSSMLERLFSYDAMAVGREQSK